MTQTQAPIKEIWHYIDQHPGIAICDLQKHFGFGNTCPDRILDAIENNGYLLAEYNNRVWTFAQVDLEGLNELKKQRGLFVSRGGWKARVSRPGGVLDKIKQAEKLVRGGSSLKAALELVHMNYKTYKKYGGKIR